MKASNYPSLLLLLALSAQGEELLRPVTFAPDRGSASLQVDEGTLRITAVPGQAQQVLIELDRPGISSPVYALKGLIRYEAVEGSGYLQLDNHFGDRGSYFTRSLAESGPLQQISGSADWRPFTLPFYAGGGGDAAGGTPSPERLTLSLHLPGNGTVLLRDVGLYQYAGGEDPMASPAQWIGSRAATLIGAVGGSVIGVWGGLVAFLVSRGRARGFVLGSTNVLIALGIASLCAGIAALAADQPYAVYYPLLLIGVILTLVLGGLRKSLPRRYEALELQKMQAMDA